MGDSEFNLDLLRKMYNKFKETNEENIKIHVVTKFLEMLGYDSSEFYYEHSMYHKDGRADIAVKIDDMTYLYVEVKSPESKLSEKEQSQLAQYLYNRGLSWGILTNGKRFILFNNSINSIPNPNRPIMIDKIVFNIDIFNVRQRELVTFYSKKNIFDKQLTNYFRDIAQFKAFKFPDGGGSWEVYKGTLLNFFKYYSSQQNRYRALGEIRIDEFEDFLRIEKELKSQKKGKKINSSETFENKYSHIRSFFQTLKIRNPGFEEEKVKLIGKMEAKEQNKDISEILTEINIEKILDFYEKRQDTLRNKTIFLLCICFGLERSSLLGLTVKSIKKESLLINGRELSLPPVISDLIKELVEENKKKKIKTENLFYSLYNNKYKPISGGTINYIFDILKEIDELWSVLSPKNIRSYLIKQLFNNNYPLEEIVYLTGADLISINSLITYNQVINKVKTRGGNSKKLHPFHIFLY